MNTGKKGVRLGSYVTLEGSVSAEIVEKKSRFIGYVAHVETEEEALEELDAVRAQHRMARHHVYAYKLREGGRVRYSDDGEPSKTAGLPTLEVIEHAGLSDLIIVTTRYFGGTLLGTGGLVRAYTQAAQAAIEAATFVTISSCIDIELDIPYTFYDQVVHLSDRLGTKVVQTDFSDKVLLHLRVLEENIEEAKRSLQELLRGQGTITVSEAFDAVF